MIACSAFSTFIIQPDYIKRCGFDACNIKGQYAQVSSKSFVYGMLKKDGSLFSNIVGTPPGKDYIQISVGGVHGVALRSNGTVVSWGNDQTPPPNRFKKIAAGCSHNVGIDMNNELVAWGNNEHGQCIVPDGKYIDVIAGAHHSLALKESGEVVAWGLNKDGQCNVPKGRYMQISTGHYHNLAIRDDGRLVAWGINNHGQCDIPDEAHGCQAIFSGLGHNIVVKNGELIGWGNNFFNQSLLLPNLK